MENRGIVDTKIGLEELKKRLLRKSMFNNVVSYIISNLRTGMVYGNRQKNRKTSEKLLSGEQDNENESVLAALNR